jgi:hypothetical protein
VSVVGAAIGDDPFPLLCAATHGGLRRNVGCGLFFAEEVAVEARDELIALVPEVMRHEMAWSRDFFYAGTADRFDKHFDSGGSDRVVLSERIDEWLRAAHARKSLAFAYVSDLPEVAGYQEWAERSVERVPDVVLPWLRAHWSARGVERAADTHAAGIVDSLAYFVLTLYAEKTPEIDERIVEELVYAADVIAATDESCGADRWRDELLARLKR